VAFEDECNNEATFSEALTKDGQWPKTLTRLLQANQKIKKHLKNLRDSDMERQLPEGTLETQVMDLALHDAYHAGQIVLIRKLKREW
jgi:hypothetical protein